MKLLLNSLILLITLPLAAIEYHVATNGNNANTGLSFAQAWLDPYKASTNAVAGDSIRVYEGLYAKRITNANSGTASARITWIADSLTNTACYGFLLNGTHNVTVRGFEMYQTNDNAIAGIRVEDSTNCWIQDNYIHNTSPDGAGGGISYGNAAYMIARRNFIAYPGSFFTAPEAPNGAIATIFNKYANDYVTIEYNTMSHVDDFINPGGSKHLIRYNIAGPTATNDFPGITPHADFIQSDDGLTNSVIYGNWHVDNPISDSHLWLHELNTVTNNAIIKNISIRSGDQLNVRFSSGGKHFLHNNVIGQVGFGPHGGPTDLAIWTHNSSTGNESFNNIFTNASSNTRIYLNESGGSLTNNYNNNWPLAVAGGANNIQTNPLFINYVGYDFRLTNTSPLIDAGRALTHCGGAGATNSTTCVVSNVNLFWDSTVVRGSKIQVGTNVLRYVVSIDYGTLTLTLNDTVTYTNGAPVSYFYTGSGPDLGVYEQGDTFLTSASMDGNYTVTCNTTNVEYVQWFSNGIPSTVDYASPFEASFSAGNITAIAHSSIPYSNMWVNASTTVNKRIGFLLRQ